MYKKAQIVTMALCLLSTFFLFSETPSNDTKIYPIAIIGSGAGGTMAVKRASLNNRDTILFTGAKKQMKSGRGYWVRKVENIPGLEKYTRTINQLREETLALIADSPFAPKLTTVHDSVLSVEKQDDIFHHSRLFWQNLPSTLRCDGYRHDGRAAPHQRQHRPNTPLCQQAVYRLLHAL